MEKDWPTVLNSPGYVSLFLVVLNSEQPRIGSVLENLLRLMEEPRWIPFLCFWNVGGRNISWLSGSPVSIAFFHALQTQRTDRDSD